jgi:tRNA G37 N-methylase Trm5
VENGTGKLIKLIREHAKRNSYSVRVAFKRTVRNYSAREIEVVIDYRISKRGGRGNKHIYLAKTT